MNYSRLNLINPLAERFVLGTMQRRSRRRFSRLLDENAEAARTVYALEDTLHPMAWSLAPVAPSEMLWHRIAKQAGLGRSTPRRKSMAWPMLAAAMSVAVIATSIGWWQSTNRPPEVVVDTVVQTVPVEPSIGVITDAGGIALWVARIYDGLARADVTVAAPPDQQAQNDYQLWILRDDGIPVSLGLLPQTGESSLALDANALDALTRGSTLAVSLEPLGGSPDVVPTGPVLYTAVMLTP